MSYLLGQFANIHIWDEAQSFVKHWHMPYILTEYSASDEFKFLPC